MKTFHLITLAILLSTACQQNTERADAYGNFEARETVVSAQGNGQILFLEAEEGQKIEAGTMVGMIDTTTLHLQREHLRARIQSLGGKTQSAQPQINILEEQKRNLQREHGRIEALLKDSAATTQQLDDLAGRIDVVDRQIAAARAQTATLNEGVLSEVAPLQAQINIIEEQIQKCAIRNPISGTVLLKLAEPHEITAPGRPLYSIAALDELELRAYVSGTQLPHLALGQTVEVWIDQDKTSNQMIEGTISWIAAEAEFTPKTIQTKEERVNLVYAIKVKVPNDGRLKIGMPAEVNFQKTGMEAKQGAQ